MRPAELEHELLHRTLVAAEEILGQRLHERCFERVGALLRPGFHDQIDVDLEVARADRGLDTVPVAAGLGEGLRHRRLARSVEPKNPALGLRRARERPPERLRVDRPRPEALQLTGRARQDDDDARAGVQDDPWRGTGDAERERTAGQRRLLADPVGKVRVWAAHPLGEPA